MELNLGYFPFLDDARKFQKLQNILARNKIRVHSFHFPYDWTVPSLGHMDISHPDADVRRNTIDAVRLCLSRLMDLNARCLVIHPSAGRFEDAERESRLMFCLESMGKCLDIMAELQLKRRNTIPLRIALETLLPLTSLVSDAPEINAFFDRLNNDSVGLCVDSNHINQGQDAIAFMRQVGSRVITTHLSDNDGVNERHWIPGKGVIPWREWLSALLSTGYTGPFLYESSQPEGVSEEETVAAIRGNADELSAMIRF